MFLALKSFCSNLSDAHVFVQVDNTTAVAYINGMGGAKSKECNTVAKQLWEWCINKNLLISAVHIPGVLNRIADFKSRHFRVETEWMLNTAVFHNMRSTFGRPLVDLLAS